MFRVPERFRVRNGEGGSDSTAGNNGLFVVPHGQGRDAIRLQAIAADGEGWEHVSVTVRARHRCPTWSEMCAVRDLFWGPEATVIQYHPPRSEYVNFHPYCLHLWRPTELTIPTPPKILI